MAPHGQFNPTENRISFDIDRNIDINSKVLLDMISENDTFSVATANVRTVGAPAAGTSNLKSSNQEKISVAEAFENW